MALHTDIPTRPEVERLLTVNDPLCVSIYLATSQLTQDAQADRIELKKLAAKAGRQLEAAGADRRAAADVRAWLDELVVDDDFWSEQARSLALFPSPERLSTFKLPNRLTSVVEVANRFYVKPLQRAITFPQAGFVLALAAGSVRLVEVTPEGAPFTVEVPGLPTDAASAAGKASIADRSPSHGFRAPRARRSDSVSSRARSTKRCAACSQASSCHSSSRRPSRWTRSTAR